ncbi:hypothetical protein GCM10009760_29770 [Kitasatospora kazusensis]|uniref:Pimeloyl-ACP methyl ester carboxylesterase n=1 Tax=Kitasatospora kazusensis TaxID=407974 RepID=A0ABN2ZK45_9ACTN
MNEASVVTPGGGETIRLGTTRMRILEDGSSTGHRLGIGEITLAPHSEGPPQHRHAEHDEGFYVVSGEARFTVGETVHEAPAGTFVMIPPGVPHTFANPGDRPAVLLNTFTPDLYVRYFRDLRDMIAAGQELTPEATVHAMSRYATVPATDFARPGPAGTSRTLALDGVELDFEDHGQGRLVLLLHGGGGPQTVAPFVRLLAGQRPARVIAPVHPGFGGTGRPDGLTSPAGLARLYARLLEELDLTGVTVVGNSLGGWVAAELALLGSDRISGVVLVNAVGIVVPGHPVADVFALSPQELSRLSFHDPAKFRIDPGALTEAQRAGAAANRAALAVYGGPASAGDPTLRGRLAGVGLPTLVLWGESDQVVDQDYGRAYAAAVPNARFQLLRGTGHVPQIETPGQLLPAVWDFVHAQDGDRTAGQRA